MAYLVAKRDGVFYAVVYEGTNPVSGRERRQWHRCPTRPAAEQLARGLGTSDSTLRFRTRRQPHPLVATDADDGEAEGSSGHGLTHVEGEERQRRAEAGGRSEVHGVECPHTGLLGDRRCQLAGSRVQLDDRQCLQVIGERRPRRRGVGGR